MSACMSGTRCSGVLSSTGDVLVRGAGGVCDMCMCLARGGVGGEGGEWTRELGLGFTMGPHGQHAQKTVNRAPITGGGEVRHNLHSSLSPLCSSTACRLCRLDS